MITSVTFFLDGTVKVCDQHGRPINGTVSRDGKVTRFDQCNHEQAIAAMDEERIDWTKLTRAGWPQLSYEKLKQLKELPPTPLDELRKIRDPQLRKDAMRIRREVDAHLEKELRAAAEE